MDVNPICFVSAWLKVPLDDTTTGSFYEWDALKTSGK